MRTLLELADRDEQSPPLNRHETLRLALGYAVAGLVILGFVLLTGFAGGMPQ